MSQFTDDSDQYRELSAKLLAMMETTLSGTLYVYQGEELGMINVPPDWAPSEYKDIESQNYVCHSFPKTRERLTSNDIRDSGRK